MIGVARGSELIKLTRLDGRELIINADEIETVEATPDTVVSLVSGRKHVVKETTGELIDRVVAYRRSLQHFPAPMDEES